MNENEFLPGNIRDRIVDLKRMTNVNNKTIAEKTGISESLLSRIESGKQQSVNDDVVLKLAKFFGVSTDFLLGRTNVPDKKIIRSRNWGFPHRRRAISIPAASM